MKKRLIAIGLALITILQVVAYSGTTVYAGTTDTWQQIRFTIGNYRAIPKVATLRDYDDYLNYVMPSESMYRLTGVRTYNGQYWISSQLAATLDAEDAYVQTWIAANIQNMVPDGSDYNTAIACIGNWIAANIKQSYAHMSDRSYFNAYRTLLDGECVPIGFACLFNSLVHALPFDASGHVNYTAGTAHLQTSLISNVNGGWSAVNVGGTWLYYDAESYALGAGPEFIQGTTDMTFGGYGIYKVASKDLLYK